MNFKTLKIDDKEIFDRYIVPYDFFICDYSFLTLLLCRVRNDISYTIIDGAMVVKERLFDGKYHFLRPIGYNRESLTPIIEKLVKFKQENGIDFLFRCADSAFINDLRELFPDRFRIMENRDSSDYLYSPSKLMELSGKSLHHKKNNYNHFIKNYKYRKENLTVAHLAECRTLVEKLIAEEKCDCNAFHEYHFLEEILTYGDSLNFEAMAVYSDDILSAFTVGEKVNDSMAIIHVERAEPDIRGLYQFINREFVTDYFSDAEFINREEDAGIESLRRSKMSYNPDRLEIKYDVT
jgi:uncharacterized protein